MNPLKLISQFLAMNQEQHDAVIKFAIAVTFCFTVVMMVGISLYSVVFVTQPMNGMAPADKQFFLILSDMSKYILGSFRGFIRLYLCIFWFSQLIRACPGTAAIRPFAFFFLPVFGVLAGIPKPVTPTKPSEYQNQTY